MKIPLLQRASAAVALPVVLFVILTVACLGLSGCYASNGRLEEEFSRGYEAGKAAAEANLLGDQDGLTGEEAQGVLAAIGEGRAWKFELKEYTIEGDVCQAYGNLELRDGNTMYVSLLLEKSDGLWRITQLGQAGPEEGPPQ